MCPPDKCVVLGGGGERELNFKNILTVFNYTSFRNANVKL